MKILAIGAHPDDIEIFMFGLLSIYSNRGDEIGMIVATDGAAGNVISNKSLSKKRKKETINALMDLGEPDLLGFPDGQLSDSKNVRSTLKEKIKKFNPDLIITHAPEDYHPDHRALSKYVIDSASFNFPVIFCEALMGVNFTPNYYIDISKHFELKKNAILKHKSQNSEKFYKAIEINNRFRAAQCNAPDGSYAEVYRFEPTFPFLDIRLLLPESLPIRSYYKNLSNSLI